MPQVTYKLLIESSNSTWIHFKLTSHAPRADSVGVPYRDRWAEADDLIEDPAELVEDMVCNIAMRDVAEIVRESFSAQLEALVYPK